MKLKIIIISLCFASIAFSAYTSITTVINGFHSGELSPLLEGRTDVKRYYTGCRTLENFVVLSQGGATKRPGTMYIAEANSISKNIRLFNFQYSTTDSYIIEAGDGYMRFYRNGGQIAAP